MCLKEHFGNCLEKSIFKVLFFWNQCLFLNLLKIYFCSWQYLQSYFDKPPSNTIFCFPSAAFSGVPEPCVHTFPNLLLLIKFSWFGVLFLRFPDFGLKYKMIPSSTGYVSPWKTNKKNILQGISRHVCPHGSWGNDLLLLSPLSSPNFAELKSASFACAAWPSMSLQRIELSAFEITE